MCNPEVATLVEDLLKSLANLDEMLKGMEKEKIIDPHVGSQKRFICKSFGRQHEGVDFSLSAQGRG